jgi:DNA processing protein
MTETEALLILLHLIGLGSRKIFSLIDHFGSAVAVLKTSSAPSAYKEIFERLHNWKEQITWQRDLELVHQHKISLISYKDPAYPLALLRLTDFPPLLYVKGELLPQDAHAIAVIGTRDPTPYGTTMGHRLSKDLAQAGFTIISGLAKGIDTIAHQAALLCGRTFAVIGSGLARIYPQENSALAEAICEAGAVISEFPMETTPQRQHFPQRNRLVSGLSKGVLLVEAPLTSGAMITMYKGHLQEKRLFAIPGNIDSKSFQGNHLLIKKGIASLVETAQDILESFDDLFPRANAWAPVHTNGQEGV